MQKKKREGGRGKACLAEQEGAFFCKVVFFSLSFSLPSLQKEEKPGVSRKKKWKKGQKSVFQALSVSLSEAKLRLNLFSSRRQYFGCYMFCVSFGTKNAACEEI